MTLKYPKTNRREVNLLTGEYVAYNCLVGDKLEVGYTLSDSFGTCPQNMATCGYMSSASRFLGYADGYVYSSLRGASFMQLVKLTADNPFTIEQYEAGQPQAILVGNTNAVVHTGAYQTTKAIGGNLKCGTMHLGRLFGIDRSDGNILRWSGEGGVFDWESGGYLHLKRGIGIGLNTFCLEDRLVILREFGITEISAFGNYENYKQGIPIATDRVLDSSGVVALNKLYFLSESGLKAYSDGDIERVECNYADRITFVHSTICWGQCYICACTHADFGEVIFVYDSLKRSSYLIETTIDSMCVGDGVFVFKDGLSYRLERKGFVLKNTADFESERGKALKSVTIEGDGKYDLEIFNGRVSRTFKNVNGKIDLLLSGREFEFTLSGTTAVKSFKAQAEVIDGV